MHIRTINSSTCVIIKYVQECLEIIHQLLCMFGLDVEKFSWVLMFLGKGKIIHVFWNNIPQDWYNPTYLDCSRFFFFCSDPCLSDSLFIYPVILLFCVFNISVFSRHFNNSDPDIPTYLFHSLTKCTNPNYF